MSTFETKTSRPEIWKRVVVDDPLPSKSKSSNRSFIKSGQRSKSKAKVLQSVSLATLNSKKKKVSLSSDNSKHKKKKKKRTRGKIILGPRLQQRVESEENKHATTTDTQDTTNITTSNNDKEEDSINNTPRSQSSLLNEGEDLVNPDTRKIFSLTDVNLPTPVRTRLVKKRMERPASSPSTRPITNTDTNTSSTRLGGSGASAAKRLRPVSQPVSFDTLETALPKGSDTNLNSWFSNLENAQQESISHKNETNRMTKELGMWESRYHMLEKEIRKRELDHHDRVLNLQTVNRTLVTENNELKNDINDVHEARREDVKVHNATMDKWKRRETNLESVRHEALVEAQLSKSRLNEQKLATASAISIAKTTKETLGAEVTRLRKQLNTKNEKEMKQIEYEKLRLEREVSRLNIEIKRVKEATKSDVAAAAAAAATAAYDVAGSSKKNNKIGQTVFNSSSKERIAKAELQLKEAVQQIEMYEKEKTNYIKEIKYLKKEATTATSFVRKKVEELNVEIESLHTKLQERKRELDEQAAVAKEQEMKWKEVQRDIGDDTKKRRELGLIITSTEQKSRETSYALSKSENNLKQEKEEHEKTIDTLKETTVKFNTLKDLHQQIEIQLKTTTEEKNINDQEILKVLKEMKKMEDVMIQMNKDKDMLENATKEQKGLLQDATRSIRGLEAQIKKIQLTNREQLAECNAEVKLAKSKTVSIIEAKRDLGLRYSKCMAQRKELELKLEKLIHDETQMKRNWESEKSNLDRKIRTISEKIKREMQVDLTKLSTKLEKSNEMFENEREHHKSTHTALEQANEEIETLVVRLAQAQEDAGTPIGQYSHLQNNMVMQQQQHHQQQHQYQQQYQQQHQQHHHQQYQQQHHQQQHQQQSNMPTWGNSNLNAEEEVELMSRTYGGASINHYDTNNNLNHSLNFHPTIHENHLHNQSTQQQQQLEQERIESVEANERAMIQRMGNTHTTTKPSSTSITAKTATSSKKQPRPQSAGRKRSNSKKKKKGTKKKQASPPGRPPLPPSQQSNNKSSTSNSRNSPPSPSLLSPPLSSRDEEGIDLPEETVPMAKIPAHVLNNNETPPGSPGQRAAAAIAGAMKFVKRRTQKRRDRRFEHALNN